MLQSAIGGKTVQSEQGEFGNLLRQLLEVTPVYLFVTGIGAALNSRTR